MTTTPGGLPYPALTDSPDLSYWNQQLAQAVEARIMGRPRAKIVAAANQSIANATATTVDLAGGTTVYDTNAMVDVTNDQLVIKTAGLYRISARAVFTSNATGYRALLILRNAAEFVADDYRNAVNGQVTVATLTTEPIALAVNDTIRAQVIQTSGAALTLTAANGAGRYSHLAAEWVAGQ